VTPLPAAVADLAATLARLPGIGPRSAERIALYLVQSDPLVARTLSETLLRARERVRHCALCGALSEGDPCPICSDPRRDDGTLCLVELPLDVLRIERSGTFRGHYHVLGGRLSPLNGVGPDDLRIAALEQRLEQQPIREIILALGSDVEGEATVHYLARRLAPRGVRLTRLAQGLPAGSGLEYADELTLCRALEGRRELSVGGVP